MPCYNSAISHVHYWVVLKNLQLRACGLCRQPGPRVEQQQQQQTCGVGILEPDTSRPDLSVSLCLWKLQGNTYTLLMFS